MPAFPSAARALPALKPNHPTHSIDAPIITIAGLWGGSTCKGNVERGPSIAAKTKADEPAVKWTTSPPAKSKSPAWNNQPLPAQIQCVTGA